MDLGTVEALPLSFSHARLASLWGAPSTLAIRECTLAVLLRFVNDASDAPRRVMDSGGLSILSRFIDGSDASGLLVCHSFKTLMALSHVSPAAALAIASPSFDFVRLTKRAVRKYGADATIGVSMLMQLTPHPLTLTRECIRPLLRELTRRVNTGLGSLSVEHAEAFVGALAVL